MAVIESIFDILYLSIVIGLGVRLLIFKGKESNLVGWMALLLGFGDAFHLVPRVMAHLTPDGFIAYERALSWGQFITGITMTIFYLLFYFYYRKQSGDLDNNKKWTIIILSAIRLVLLMLPQNNWGIVNGNYRMGIIRNIPFLIMGLLLIFWTYKKRKVSGLNNMSIWIFLSFAFYIPVVLWASKYPMLGALMMPKTIAYVLLILEGYKYYINEFKPENLYDISFTFLIMGLVAGVFYREFTKYFNFNGATHLGKLHVHTLVLGFILIFVLYLATRGKNREKFIKLKKPFMTYMVGLIFTIVTMTVYGIYDVVGKEEGIISIPMISGFSGLGHIILSIGLVWMLIKLKKNYEISYENSKS